MWGRWSVAVFGAIVTAVACGGGDVEPASGPMTPAQGPTTSVPVGPPVPDASLAVPDSSLPIVAGHDAGENDASGDAALAPTPYDGIKNGSETDVDCGGPLATTPRCPLYKVCLGEPDCAAGATCFLDDSGTGECRIARSCTGASGTRTCGPDGAPQDCCITLPVPGGSFLRQQDPMQPATVSSFKLDKYEITVGRLRSYFEAVGGSPKAAAPAPGAGAHPKIPNSGWRSSFDVRLPASWVEIDERLGAFGCAVGGDNADGGAATWTPAPGPYEDLPITCLDWYTLFAFCAWDGGRLPTDAEWEYAAAGGDQQRPYAWGDGPATLPFTPEVRALVATSIIDPVDNIFLLTVGTPFRTTDPVTGKVNDGPAHISQPGRKTGYGRWGHADMTGNVLEYLLDVTPIPLAPCVDCARVDFADPPQDQVGYYPPNWYLGAPDKDNEADFPDGRRSLRGGSWDIHVLVTTYRYHYRIYNTYYAAGGRCARD